MLNLEAVKFMKDLFCSKETIQAPSYEHHLCKLNPEERMALLSPVTKEEVYNALMSMKSFKAPGPDGFQPIFYKMFWEEIGDDLWHFVRSAFEEGHFDGSITEILLVLIPKGDNPQSFKEFRPISLCNVIFKIISKCLVWEDFGQFWL